MGGTFLKTLAAGAAVTAITLGAVGATSPAAAANVWPHGGGGWHGGGGGWHGGGGGWHGGGGGWRGGYGGWGWRGAGWGWGGPGWYGGGYYAGWGYPYGWGWGAPAVAVGVSAPAYYYPANSGCWQVRAVYSQGGAYLGNRSVNVCQ
jgi:hypothetical protein